MNNSFADWNPMEENSDNATTSSENVNPDLTNNTVVLDNTSQMPAVDGDASTLPTEVANPSEEVLSSTTEIPVQDVNTSTTEIPVQDMNTSTTEIPVQDMNTSTTEIPVQDVNASAMEVNTVNIIGANDLEVSDTASSTTSEANPFVAPIIDPTASYETNLNNTTPIQVVDNIDQVDTTNQETSVNSDLTTPAPSINPVLSNSGIRADTIDPNVRYNPVTGEEVDVSDLTSQSEGEKPLPENKKKSKGSSTWNSILVFFLFIFLVIFVYFLPEIHTVVTKYQKGTIEEEVEVITSGKLVCTLETNTVNLDRDIERIFLFDNNQLKSSKFTTVVRGDPSLDEETLDQLNEQCNKIKENVNGLDGISVDCNYELGKLEEKESFDYQTYSVDDVNYAYLDAGATILELDYDEDIDKVMTKMRQGGFTCNKEK